MILLSLLVSLLFSLSTHANTPICSEIGSENEGWYINGKLIKNSHDELKIEKCSQLFAECRNKNTNNEGWYAISKVNIINWSKCSEANFSQKPYCDNINSPEESWHQNNQIMKRFNNKPAWDNCQNKIIECRNIGTKSEGWYAVTQPKLIIRANCTGHKQIAIK